MKQKNQMLETFRKTTFTHYFPQYEPWVDFMLQRTNERHDKDKLA